MFLGKSPEEGKVEMVTVSAKDQVGGMMGRSGEAIWVAQESARRHSVEIIIFAGSRGPCR